LLMKPAWTTAKLRSRFDKSYSVNKRVLAESNYAT